MHRADLSPAHPGHGQNAKNPLTAQVGAHFTPRSHIRPGAHFTPRSHIRPTARSAHAISPRNNNGGKTTAAPDSTSEKHKNAAATRIRPYSQSAETIQELSANIEF